MDFSHVYDIGNIPFFTWLCGMLWSYKGPSKPFWVKPWHLTIQVMKFIPNRSDEILKRSTFAIKVRVGNWIEVWRHEVQRLWHWHYSRLFFTMGILLIAISYQFQMTLKLDLGDDTFQITWASCCYITLGL